MTKQRFLEYLVSYDTFKIKIAITSIFVSREHSFLSYDTIFVHITRYYNAITNSNLSLHTTNTMFP